MLPKCRYSSWLPGERPPKKPHLFFLGGTGASVALLAMMILAATQNIEGFPYAFALIGFSYVLLIVGAVVESRRRKERIPARDLPSSIEQFPALLLFRREVGYGNTEGLISFVDGWLVFSSRSTEFSVRRDDVKIDMGAVNMSFTFPGPHGEHRAVLHPIGRGLRQAWTEWAWASAGVSGTPLYPPVVPSPSGRLRLSWVGKGRALSMFLMGLVSLRLFAPVAIAELTFAAVAILLDRSAHDAYRRLEQGRPPRARLRGAWTSFRQGDSFRTVAQRALGHAERALR